MNQSISNFVQFFGAFEPDAGECITMLDSRYEPG
jgi:hypothetical protein